MTGEDVFNSSAFQKCVAFHGHFCPGLSIGFRAAKAGLDWLAENRSPDEQIVAVVENDACGTDAVQVLTGCTFGKGNFIFKDLGKQAFTFFSRGAGTAVRLSLKPGALDPDPAHRDLGVKVRSGIASPEEQTRFQDLHTAKGLRVLGMPLDDLFTVTRVDEPAPPAARIMKSVACDACGEPAMESRIRKHLGKCLCLECAEKSGAA